MIARAVYGTTVFLSALLLFLVQPVLAGVMLPWFGGSAGVWSACMLFFQAVLLLGYSYAHGMNRYVPLRIQLAVHSVAAGLSVALLPLQLSPPVIESGGGAPVLQVLWLLTRSAGLPCLLLSATSPLIQSWSRRTVTGIPYRLFAVSNAASLLALLAYPVAVEPVLRKSSQLQIWSIAYAVCVALLVWSAIQTKPAVKRRIIDQPLEAGDRWMWIALSASASALWLAIANQISQSVAPVPLIWILPLSVYLLSMMLCFTEGLYNPRLFRWLMPVAIAALVLAINQHDWSSRIGWGLALFNGGLFIFCMICHGELYARRPEAADLTAFYLRVAAGGVLGAIFVSLLAPLLFTRYLELPIAIVACTVLALALLYGYRSRRNFLRLGLVSTIALVATTLAPDPSRWRARNFYGVLDVREGASAAAPFRALYNGSILHGLEWLTPGRTRDATTYFGPRTGVGKELSSPAAPGRRVGVIGLGVGTLASYGRRGDTYRFYELNPLVIQAATTRFAFLRESAATIELVSADARLALEREAPQNFDLLAVDAFTGDVVPVHLLTREAFVLYFRHLKADGVLAVHVTSKYLNLAPLVLRTTASMGRNAEVVVNGSDPPSQTMSATWVIVKGTRAPSAEAGVWTDDYSSLFQVLR